MWAEFPWIPAKWFKMFYGFYEHTIDPKGRLSIPSKFREVLSASGNDRIMVTNFIVDGQRCLEVYPMDAWHRLLETVESKPQFNSLMNSFQNFYLGGACECQLDPHGRVLIPPVLRKYAGLERDVTLVSVTKKFRIWDRKVWHAVHGAVEEKLIQDPGFFNDVGF